MPFGIMCSTQRFSYNCFKSFHIKQMFREDVVSNSILLKNIVKNDSILQTANSFVNITVEPALSSHSYEQPTSYRRPLDYFPKRHFLFK